MKKLQERDYQLAARSYTKRALDETNRALVVMTMGLGKTVVVMKVIQEEILRSEPNAKILYLCHLNESFKQAQKAMRQIELNCSYANFFGTGEQKDWDIEDKTIVFASFQSLGGIEDWYTVIDPAHFDYVIVDEAHHGKAPAYEKIILYFARAKRIGLTGTPIRADEKDITEIFGEPVINLPLEWGIASQWLADVEYRVMDDGISNARLEEVLHEIKEEGHRISVKSLNERIFIGSRTNEQVRIIKQYAKGHQTMVYCEGIPHAKHMGEVFGDNAVVIHSKVRGKKSALLDSFRGKQKQFAVTVDMFNEVLDVPDVWCIALVRATDSLTIWLQQIGRALRALFDKHGKQIKKVVILDFVANCERLLMVKELSQRVNQFADELGTGGRFDPGFDKLEVSGEHYTFRFSDKVVDLMKVLEVLRDGFYPTWEEASNVAVRLGIASERDYRVRYKDDLGLPSVPTKVYPNFPGWYTFLGKGLPKDFYPTWQEAADATRSRKIKGQLEYKKRYEEDPRLPCNPHSFYSDYPGDTRFFTGKSPKAYYPTWQEASQAARALGILSSSKYAKRYKEDPRLHSNPETFYKDFPGSYTFFNTEPPKAYYPTWQEAAEAVRKLGITDHGQYLKRYSEDSRLPSNPGSPYKDFPGFPIFLRGESPKDFYPTLQGTPFFAHLF